MRTFGKILKYTVIAMLVVFLAFIAVRIMMTADRSTLSDIVPTESAKAAYAQHGKDAFLTHDLPSDISKDGYFTAYALSYSESEKELQITVRFNDGLYETYLPGSDPDNYYFKLCDADGNTVATGTRVAERERYFYNYLRIAFEDIEIGEDTELYLFLCDDESSYPADHTEGLLIHHPAINFKKLSVSKDERNSLES